MIQRTATLVEVRSAEPQPERWQALLANAINTPEALLQEVGLNPTEWLEGAERGHRLFPVLVPKPYLQRIGYGDPQDPLLRQVLPLLEEGVTLPGYSPDPLEERSASPVRGLIRKYRSRALLMVTGQCAINCRYCFRRSFPYGDHSLSPQARQQVIDTLAADPALNEVILSGGDPLAVNDRLISQWLDAIAGVSHIRRLRIHSRLPVVIPQRVTPALLAALSGSRLKVVLVVHVNHPQEIDADFAAAMGQLKEAGVTLLNQSVILRGVNDHADTLEALSERLFEVGILPYYLHAFDPVQGAAHFDVADAKATTLMTELRTRLPGFLVPRLVRELPGRPSKTPLD
ncbi:MAG: EF-P beta-lysylation protein EpmB [Marinobacter sp.]|nr:EF-P beta-lysylation protein EpmB [Marinobacter sp.]